MICTKHICDIFYKLIRKHLTYTLYVIYTPCADLYQSQLKKYIQDVSHVRQYNCILGTKDRLIWLDFNLQFW